MSDKSDIGRDAFQLTGGQAFRGYDWWWHSFTAVSRSTGRQRPFFIEFFLINPALGQEEPVFGQTDEKAKPSYLMVKAGAWGEGAVQLHRFFGWKKVKAGKGVPFSIVADDCYLDETATYGHVSVSREDAAAHPEYMSGAGEMSWSLKIDKKIAFNVGYGAGKLFRRLQAFEMFWHAEGMKTFFEGEVVFNGEVYDVRRDDCYGYADKNWGKDFTSPLVWLASSSLTSTLTGRKLDGSAFDIGGGRPKCGPLVLERQLLSQLVHEGHCYEFNFSKFWTFPRTRFDCRETEEEIVWHVDQSAMFSRMVADIRCRKKDMLLVNYESPDGKKRHDRLWNGGNGAGTVKLYRFGRLKDELHCENVGCEYGEYSC